MVELNNIHLGIETKSKNDLLKIIGTKLHEKGITSDAKKLSKALLKRENQGTTGFGNGIAIPHTQDKCVLFLQFHSSTLKNQLILMLLMANQLNHCLS